MNKKTGYAKLSTGLLATKGIKTEYLFDFLGTLLSINKFLREYTYMDNKSLMAIKKSIQAKKGQNIHLRALYGRRGKLICDGVVDGVYPEIFTIKVSNDGYDRKYCYTYSEVLTNNVQISPIV